MRHSSDAGQHHQRATTVLVLKGGQTGLASRNFNATTNDYARLRLVMANDCQRDSKAAAPADWLLLLTDAFRSGRMPNLGRTDMGHGLQTWLVPSHTRRVALQHVHGQAIMVVPGRKLVRVHMAAGKDASGDTSGTYLGQERGALWRRIVARYGNW